MHRPQDDELKQIMERAYASERGVVVTSPDAAVLRRRFYHVRRAVADERYEQLSFVIRAEEPSKIWIRRKTKSPTN